MKIQGIKLNKLWLLFLCLLSIETLASPLPLNQIQLPPGFQIETYVENIPNARAMTMSANGTLFVGSRHEGKVYAVNPDKKLYVIADNLQMPAGVAYRDGSLYVSAVNKILRFDDIEERLSNPPEPIIVNDSLPTNTQHGWKFIAFGPDDWLYVPVGAPCNNCLSTDKRFASIMRMKPDGSNLEIFAHGVRNTVGFDWHPSTKALWFTDNGRDWMGDDLPSDELNAAPQAGMHFGYPFCHAGTISDPEFGIERPCTDFAKPQVNLGAHVAALGMRFYTGAMFPRKYHNKVFIAEHGSWNSSVPRGYRITFIDSDQEGRDQYQVFASGWLQESSSSEAWGRPADVLVMADGSLLISDDKAGAIYRISYKQEPS